MYPLTPTLSVAAMLVMGTVRFVADTGSLKEVTTGAVVSGRVMTTAAVDAVETLPAASFAQA
jgi:hypothetical protein